MIKFRPIFLLSIIPIPIIYWNLIFGLDQDITQHLLMIKKSLSDQILYRDYTNNYGPLLPMLYKFISLNFLSLGYNYFLATLIFYFYSVFVLKNFLEIFLEKNYSSFLSIILSAANILFVGGIYQDNLCFIIIINSLTFFYYSILSNNIKYIYITNFLLVLALMCKSSYGFISLFILNLLLFYHYQIKNYLHIIVSIFIFFLFFLVITFFLNFYNFYEYTIKLPYSFVLNLFNNNPENLYPEKNILQLFYILIFPLKIDLIQLFFDLSNKSNGFTRILFLPIMLSYYFFYFYFFKNFKNLFTDKKYFLINTIFIISICNSIFFGKNFHILFLFHAIFFILFTSYLNNWKKIKLLLFYLIFITLILPFNTFIKFKDISYIENSHSKPLKIFDTSFKNYKSSEIEKILFKLNDINSDCFVYVDDEINFSIFTDKNNQNYFTDYNFYQSIYFDIDMYKNTSIPDIDKNKKNCVFLLSNNDNRFFRTNKSKKHKQLLLRYLKDNYLHNKLLEKKIIIFSNKIVNY